MGGAWYATVQGPATRKMDKMLKEGELRVKERKEGKGDTSVTLG